MAKPGAIRPSSGLYRIWIIAIAEVAGQKYTCLRLVNAQVKDGKGEFDRRYPHQHADAPFFHVPTTTIPYDPEQRMPAAYTVAQQALLQIGQDWPALRRGRFMCWHCNTSGAWGGFTQDHKPEPVLRVVWSFGELERLPRVIYRPKERLPSRQPVGWVPFGEMFRVPGTRLARQGSRTSPCVIGKVIFPGPGGRSTAVYDTILQDSVFGGLAHAVGRYSFPLLPKGKTLDPRLEVVGPRSPTP